MQLFLDVSDFDEQDLRIILRELRDSDVIESIESLTETLESGAKGDWLNKLLVELKPENLPRVLKLLSDIFWQFAVPPKIIITADSEKIRIEVNRKEDLDEAIAKALELFNKKE